MVQDAQVRSGLKCQGRVDTLPLVVRTVVTDAEFVTIAEGFTDLQEGVPVETGLRPVDFQSVNHPDVGEEVQNRTPHACQEVEPILDVISVTGEIVHRMPQAGTADEAMDDVVELKALGHNSGDHHHDARSEVDPVGVCLAIAKPRKRA